VLAAALGALAAAGCAPLALPVTARAPAAPLDAAAVAARSAALADAYQSELLAALQGAMAAGGPAGAIEVCAEIAPAIAARLSEESGATVGRTALRLRNPASAPDDRTREQLLQLAAEPLDADGRPRALVWRSADGQTDHYLRAIPLRAPCTACHGVSIAPEVKAAIASRYSADQATGFREGDFRGAFWIRWPATTPGG
jgi:hypothetical protein